METKTNAVSWADVVAERQRREDEPIARRRLDNYKGGQNCRQKGVTK